MLQMSNIETIERRAHAIGCTLGALAREVGLAHSTPYRWRQGVSPNTRTLTQIEQALMKREAAVRDHLASVAEVRP